MRQPLITPDMVELDLTGSDRATVSRILAQRLAEAGRVTDLDRFLADVCSREEQMATGLEGGIGIPHCRSATVTAPTLAFGRSADGVDFGATDGPARLIFLIAAPEGGGSEHMAVLAALARRLARTEFRQTLSEAVDPAAIADYIQREVGS